MTEINPTLDLLLKDVEILETMAAEAWTEAVLAYEEGTEAGYRRGNQFSEVFDNLCLQACRRKYPGADRYDEAVLRYQDRMYYRLWDARYGEWA